MTLIELSKRIDELMKDKDNHQKVIIGDVKPGSLVNKIESYGKWFISIYDERRVE